MDAVFATVSAIFDDAQKNKKWTILENMVLLCRNYTINSWICIFTAQNIVFKNLWNTFD